MSTYDLYKNKSYNLRIPNEMRIKAQIISEAEGFKKMSKFYEHIISAYIANYEEKNGPINIQEEVK